MKKKIFLAVIAVLVICLTCGMLLVACNKDEGEGKDDIQGRPDTPKDILNKVITSFGDVAADNANDVKEFNFGIEIGNYDDEVLFSLAFETLEGEDFIYAAVGDDVYKIKGFDLGGVVELVLGWLDDDNGYILDMVPTDADGFIDELSDTLATLALADAQQMGDAYMLSLNIGWLLDLLNENVDVDGEIAKLGLSGVIGTVINVLDDALDIGLATEDSDGNVVAPTVGDLLNYISKNVKFNFYFGFGANADKGEGEAEAKPFGDFAISDMVMEMRDEPAINVLNFAGKIEIDALNIATSETPDADTQAEDVTTSYVLDINVDIDPFVLLREHGEYKYGILSLLEPDGKLALKGSTFTLKFKDFEPSVIIDMIDEAGYIHISLDKVATAAEGDVKVGDVVKNLFTLHYDSKEGAVVASAAILDQVAGSDYAIGGVYDMEALVTIVDMLANADKYKETPSGSDAAEGDAKVKPCEDGNHIDTDPADCKCDVCGEQIDHKNTDNDCYCDVCGAGINHKDEDKDSVCDVEDCKAVISWTGLIDYIVSNIGNFVDMPKDESGKITSVTVKLSDIADYVIDTFLKLTEDQQSMVDTALPGLMVSVLGGNALRIDDVDGIEFKYGGVTTHKPFTELKYNLREDTELTGSNDDNYMASITSIEGDSYEVGAEVTVTGLEFDGETEITTDGIIMAEYDGTLYIGIVTDFYANYDAANSLVNQFIGGESNIDLGMLIKPNWPFYGVLTCPVPDEA